MATLGFDLEKGVKGFGWILVILEIKRGSVDKPMD